MNEFFINMINDEYHFIDIFALYNIYDTRHLHEVVFNNVCDFFFLISPEIRQYSREFYLSFVATRRVIVATNRLYTPTLYYCEAHHGRMRATKR